MRSTRARSGRGSSGRSTPRWSSASVPCSTRREAPTRATCRSRSKTSTCRRAWTTARADARLGLLDSLRKDFLSSHPGVGPVSHQDAYLRAVRLMRSAAAKAFELEDEPAAVRDAYGRTAFGQGCLLARRLVERGVPFVEVTLSSAERGDGGRLGHAPAELRGGQAAQRGARPGVGGPDGRPAQRGLLDSTLIVWMGEFGRTPKINPQAGRDHFPAAWTTVLAGGGIKGGQVIGSSGADGMEAKDRPVVGPRLPGHGLQGAGHRPHGTERLRHRPADPDRRPQGQTDPGGARMNSLVLACWSLARGGRARACIPRRPMPTTAARSQPGSSDADRDAVQDVMFLSDTRPIFIRLRLDAGRQGVPRGLARRGESHPCLPRPRQRRHPDQG